MKEGKGLKITNIGPMKVYGVALIVLLFLSTAGYICAEISEAAIKPPYEVDKFFKSLIAGYSLTIVNSLFSVVLMGA